MDAEDCGPHPATLREEESPSANTPTKHAQPAGDNEEEEPPSFTAAPEADAAQTQQETESGSHVDRTISTGSKETSSPDEGELLGSGCFVAFCGLL